MSNKTTNYDGFANYFIKTYSDPSISKDLENFAVQQAYAHVTRSYPSLNIYYLKDEGPTNISLDALKNLYITAGENWKELNKRIYFLEEENGDLKAQWKDISGMYTSLTDPTHQQEKQKERMVTSKNYVEIDIKKLGLGIPNMNNMPEISSNIKGDPVVQFYRNIIEKVINNPHISPMLIRLIDACKGGGGNTAGNKVNIALQENNTTKYTIGGKVAAATSQPILVSVFRGNKPLSMDHIRFGTFPAAGTIEDSKKRNLLNAGKASKDINVEKIDELTRTYFEVELVDLTFTPQPTTGTTVNYLERIEIGHTQAVSTEKIIAIKEAYEWTEQKVKELDEGYSEFKEKAIPWLISTIKQLDDLILIARAVGRVVEVTNTTDTAEVYNSLLDKDKKVDIQKLGGTDYLGVYAIVDNKIKQVEPTVITNSITTKFFEGGKLFLPYLKANNGGIQAALERNLLRKAEEIGRREMSPSIVSLLLLASNGKIFKDSNLLKLVQKHIRRNERQIKGTKVFLPIIRIKKKFIKKLRFEKFRYTVKPQKKNNTRSQKRGFFKKGTSPGQNLSSSSSLLVDTINANMFQAVKDQMTGKNETLVNRTGKFARSVKAISVVDDTLKFTYMKRPYEVFAESGGKSPWNSFHTRDPSYIVNEAIKSLTSKKLISGISTVTSV